MTDSGLAMRDEGGEPLASTVTFVPGSSSGTVEVPIELAAAPEGGVAAAGVHEAIVKDGVEVMAREVPAMPAPKAWAPSPEEEAADPSPMPQTGVGLPGLLGTPLLAGAAALAGARSVAAGRAETR